MKTKLFFKLLFFCFSQLGFAYTLLAQEKGVLSLSLNVIYNTKPVNEAVVKFTSENKEVELNLTQDNGRYTTIVPFENTYFITIGKDSLVPKIIKVDTRIPEKFRKAFFYNKIAIELFEKYDKSVFSTVLKEPYAEVKFNPLLSNFEVVYNKKIKKSDQKAKEIAKALHKDTINSGPDLIAAEKVKAQQELAKIKEAERKKALLLEEQRKKEIALQKRQKDSLNAQAMSEKQAIDIKSKVEKQGIELEQKKEGDLSLAKENEENKIREEEHRQYLEKQRIRDAAKSEADKLAMQQQEMAKKDLEEQNEKYKKSAVAKDAIRNQKLSELRTAKQHADEEEKRNADLQEAKLKEEKIKSAQLQKQDLDEKEKAQKQTKLLLEKARLDEEVKIENEKKLAREAEEKNQQKIKEAKAFNALEEEKQKTLKDAAEKKAKDEKTTLELAQKQADEISLMKEQLALQAKEKAQKDEMERQRLLEIQRMEADALAKKMQDKAKENLRKEEADAKRAEEIENRKQLLAKAKAKEAELAAKKAFEADLEAKQKKLSLEKNNRLKEKDIAALIQEYNAHPKGRVEIFDGYKIFRIVLKENETTYTLYKRATYSFGEYFFQNNRSITKTTFEKNTHLIKVLPISCTTFSFS
jgi:hypothetical protein